ncbi:hypothetical protein D3C72_1697220 [compost metagenome]
MKWHGIGTDEAARLTDHRIVDKPAPWIADPGWVIPYPLGSSRPAPDVRDEGRARKALADSARPDRVDQSPKSCSR